MAAPASSDIAHLLSLRTVRERAQLVFQAAKEGSLNSFEYDAQRMPAVAEYVIGIISRDFGPDRFAEIPPHGRWQHFNVGGVDRIAPLLQQWEAAGADKPELARRLIDLFFVSVLLDAGAGDTWTFKEPGTGQVYNRSEGIAVASLYMFTAGVFSAEGSSNACSVHADGLKRLSEGVFNQHFQITPENPMVGVASRVGLLNKVGQSLHECPGAAQIFKPEGRPGNIVDYVISLSKEPETLDYEVLWVTLQAVLIPSWPKNRTSIAGNPIGDAWPLKVLAQIAQKEGDNSETANIQPFHKLTQWLGYSLTVPFVRILGFKVVHDDLGTGLPEYRNGGLFYDLGALKLKPDALEDGLQASGQALPLFSATGDTIVEWRAMTVALLDELFTLVSAHFAKVGVSLTMAQMLEAGTWKGGRELAAQHRPLTKSSPILIDGDGTLF